MTEPDLPDLPDLPEESGMFEMPDLDALLGQAVELQEQLLAAQAQAAEVVVEGRSGGGAVTVAVTGGMEFRSVQIRPDAVDPDDVDLLQDLVLAALRDAMDQVSELQQQSMGALGGGGLGGLLGGDDEPPLPDLDGS